MIHADLHGKLSADGSNAHSRSEDLLTSTVFGLLRYLPVQSALAPLMGLARPVRLKGNTVRLEDGNPTLAAQLTAAASCDVDFWPRSRIGEPDLLLTFRDASLAPLHRVVIEAKLHSGKSGSSGPGDTDLSISPGIHPDQLVKYWRAYAGDTPHTLVYLTPPPAPLDELRESLSEDCTMDLSWLSWRASGTRFTRSPVSGPRHWRRRTSVRCSATVATGRWRRSIHLSPNCPPSFGSGSNAGSDRRYRRDRREPASGRPYD